jgi:hypothetical protein
LEAGQQISIVTQDGKSRTYDVLSVDNVPWREKGFGELTQHLEFMSPGGPERVTLVSCAGAEIEPFPERVYVVAQPVQ